MLFLASSILVFTLNINLCLNYCTFTPVTCHTGYQQRSLQIPGDSRRKIRRRFLETWLRHHPSNYSGELRFPRPADDRY